MARNITVFGPAHSGKSTLLGYINASSMEKRKFEEFLEKVKAELGSDYDKSRAYGYLMDTGKGERSRTNRNMSTTKETHFLKVNGVHLDDIIFIDTPGTTNDYRRFREQLRAVYLGEYGVYVLEYSTAIQLLAKLNTEDELKFIHQYLSPAFLWAERFGWNSLLLALTKVDEGEYSSNTINLIIRSIRNVLQTDDVKIIPISIDVDERQEHNLFTASKFMRWYKGDTFMSELSKMLMDKEHTADKGTVSFAHIDRTFEHTKVTKEAAYRFKCLSGSFSVQQKVKIAPLKPNNIAISCNIKSILHDAIGKREKISDKAIAGFMFSQIRQNDRQFSGDINLRKATVMVDYDTDLLVGNMLTLQCEIDIKKLDVQQIDVIWLGVIYKGVVITKNHDILKILLNTVVCIPNDKTIFKYTSTMLLNGLPTKEIFRASLIHVEMLQKIDTHEDTSTSETILSVNNLIRNSHYYDDETINSIFKKCSSNINQMRKYPFICEEMII